MPAVSAPNGKFAFDAGALSVPSPMFMARAAGTLTLPLGDRFGLQADVSLASAPGLSASAALHLFTRDPASYLIGGTLGFVHTPGATVVAAGPEAELYFDRWTLEAWGGAAIAWPVAPPGPARVAPFILADLAYYPTDDWRVSAGISSLDGYNTLEFSSEFLLRDLDFPLSLTATARLGQDGAVRALVGLSGYFGPSGDKSLIRRHREDDPSDRGTSLYNAFGGAASSPAAHGKPPSAGPDLSTCPSLFIFTDEHGEPFCDLDP